MKIMNRRIVISQNGIPRIYEYYGNPEKKIGIGGIDYLGYVIIDYKTKNPYYIYDGRTIFLSDMEKRILEDLSKQKKEKVKRAYLGNKKYAVSELYRHNPAAAM